MTRAGFHLFYLHDWRDVPGHGEGTPWYQISTSDFVHFQEHGQMLARGTKDEQDLYVFTDRPSRREGRYHIFLRGHNPYFRRAGKARRRRHARGQRRPVALEETPGRHFYAPPASYERHDWRDPFVFWNDEAKEYWMLVAARLKTGPHEGAAARRSAPRKISATGRFASPSGRRDCTSPTSARICSASAIGGTWYIPSSPND